MQIFINDQPVHCDENATITSMLQQQGISSDNIAIAIDNRVISKLKWDTTPLLDGNRIIIIKAVQGG